MQKKLPKKENTSEEIEMVLGLCILQSTSKYQEELAKANISINSASSFESFTEKVAEQLTTSCDKFVDILFVLMKDENSATHQQITIDSMANHPETALLYLTGKVIKLEETSILRIWLEHNNGADVFICLDTFTGMDIVKNMDQLRGKIVRIHYQNIEIYSPKEKEVIDMKKVKKVEIID